MKIALEDVAPLHFAAGRLLLAAPCMALAAAFALGGVRPLLRIPPKADWPLVLAAAVLQIGAMLILIHIGVYYVDSGRAAVLAYTSPLWVAPLARIFLGETIAPLTLAGLLAGLSGLVMLFSPAAVDWDDEAKTLYGSAALLVGALAQALSILIMRARPMKSSSLALAPWQFFLAAMWAAPLALWLAADGESEWTLRAVLILAYNAPMTAFLFWGLIRISQLLPATTTSVTFLGVPAIGVASAMLLLGERPLAPEWLGIALIGGGVFCVIRAGRG
jgi:drug/metabolite transporter (DMT)-like permease